MSPARRGSGTGRAGVVLLVACVACESILGLERTKPAVTPAAAGRNTAAGEAGMPSEAASGQGGGTSDGAPTRAGAGAGGRRASGGEGGKLASSLGGRGSVASAGEGATATGGVGGTSAGTATSGAGEGGESGEGGGGGASGRHAGGGAGAAGKAGENQAGEGGAPSPPDCDPSLCVCDRAEQCIDPTWADWPMPNTPSGLAWPGVSSEPLPTPQHYDATTAPGIVIDTVTGLMWQAALDPRSFTWTDARAYCPTLSLGGHHDWRLPTRIELVSIVDFARSGPAIDPSVFPATPATYFWTNSQNPPYVFYVNFDEGLVDYSSTSDTNTFRVRCVR
ncbi:MAG TPA: DUF1566 domain-containing protein [Polyangiaceae bacterium]|nr:DUF1566 domain-containing protein [Polyangiaceae bacterium]